MKLTMKLVLGGALALASVHAFADVSVPPPPYDGPLTLPTAAGFNGSAILTLFSKNDATPYSYVFNLGLNFNDLLPTNGMNTPGTLLQWNLTGLSVPSSVATSDLAWSVTAVSAGGNLVTAGAIKIETTAAQSVTLANVAATTGTNLQNVANKNNQFLNNINANGTSNPWVTTNPADTIYANANWDSTLTGIGFTAASDTSSSANFYELMNVARGTGAVAPPTQYAGIWSLDLANLMLTYSVEGGGGSDVPLPAGVWLLLSSLAGMGVLRRRKPAAEVA